MLRFGFAPFSAVPSPEGIDSVKKLNINLITDSAFGVGVTTPASVTFLGKAGLTAQVAIGVYKELDVALITALSSQAYANIPVMVRADLQSNLSGLIAIDSHKLINVESLTLPQFALAVNAFKTVNFVSDTITEFYLAINMPVILGVNLNAYSDFDVDTVTTTVDYIDVTLQAGDELRLDSDNYTLTINGINVLHLYEGDFLELSRQLYRLVISSSEGELSGQLLFEELYL